MLRPLYRIGQPVHVHAFGAWRPGTVTKIGRSRVAVNFVRNTNGVIAARRFPPALVRPADGARLVSAQDLRPGDTVLDPAPSRAASASSGDVERVVATVDAARRTRRITFTDGSTTEIPVGTVLRVRARQQSVSAEREAVDALPADPRHAQWERLGQCLFCGQALYRPDPTASRADLVTVDGVNTCRERIRQLGGGTGHVTDQPAHTAATRSPNQDKEDRT